jgi:hypothetical protein
MTICGSRRDFVKYSQRVSVILTVGTVIIVQICITYIHTYIEEDGKSWLRRPKLYKGVVEPYKKKNIHTYIHSIDP